jgi:hypothetical protein
VTFYCDFNLFRVDVTSDVHLLDFNKRILILKMHGANIKIFYDFWDISCTVKCS